MRRPRFLTTTHRRRNEEYATELFGQGTALFVTMQILLIMKYNHQNVGGSDLPTPYSFFLDEFSFSSKLISSIISFKEFLF